MNRSILIVIADFLLVSLLTFSSFEVDKMLPDKTPAKVQPKLNPDSLSGNKDLVNVLKGALDEERRVRQQLSGELSQTQENIRDQGSLLADREKQNQALQQSLLQKEQQARQLEQERGVLQQQYAAAQTNLVILQRQLETTSTEAKVSKEKLVLTEARLREEFEKAATMQQKLAEMETNRQTLESEKSQLSNELKTAQTEKGHAIQQLAAAQTEVQTVRSEKARILQHADKLADGVTTLAQSSDQMAVRIAALATNSGNLAKEVREYRPLAANTIFSDFATNRVPGRISVSRSGMFGIDHNRKRDIETILVTDGTNTMAICHVDDTPFSFMDPGTDWQGLTGTLGRGPNPLPIKSLSFCLLDPRLVMIPLTQEEARQLGSRVYRLAENPFKFQEAVLVGAREGYYGECKFQIDLATPQYVRMDRNLFKGIFGKFNPSRGDLVFCRTGDFLGVMANGSYCFVMHNFKASITFQFGEDAPQQYTGSVLSRFFRLIAAMPIRLQ
ncbi:MAG TPA: hypothetical protein P5055_17650 [Candidatus Paceibacterota bacterium]|nr:hypothetical protein [Candidatus Paceibacterota bacterium]